MNGGSGADTFNFDSVIGTSTDSGTTTVAGENNDTGEDTITGFAFGSDVIKVTVASGQVAFVHGTDTGIGTADADAAATGIAGDYAVTVGLIDLDNDAVYNSAEDVAITFASPTAAVTEARFEAALQYDLTLATGGIAVTTGGQADTVTGNTGGDTISLGAGDDTVDAAGGADTVTLGTGDDTVTQNYGDSVAAGAGSITDSAGVAHGAGDAIAATDIITFASGVDVINGFTAGAGGDVISGLTTSGAPTSAIGAAEDALVAGAADDLLFLSGSFNATTNVFTVAADGTGADTLIFDVDLSDSEDIDATTGAFVLVGVDSDDLVAADFTA